MSFQLLAFGSTMRALYLFLLCTLLALPAMPVAAQSLSAFNGYWSGLWRGGSKDAIPVFMHIQSGKVREYVWDGRPVEVSQTTLKGGALAVKGPRLNILIQPGGTKRLLAMTSNKRETAQLTPTKREAWKRTPVTFASYYGGTPRKRGHNPKISSRHLDPNCCFGRFQRKAPHAGVDFNAPRHSAAIATADGTVHRFYSAFNSYGCGNGITIKHKGGHYSSYCHLEAVAPLRKGQRIKRGTIVGTVGSSGAASRDMPHIHYELTRDGDPHDDGDTRATRDPMPYFVGCFGTPPPGQAKLELTYPVLCTSKSYKAR